MINRLGCWLWRHDDEFIPVQISYVMCDTTGYLSPYISNGTQVGKRKTIYRQCKRCKREKEIGT